MKKYSLMLFAIIAIVVVIAFCVATKNDKQNSAQSNIQINAQTQEEDENIPNSQAIQIDEASKNEFQKEEDSANEASVEEEPKVESSVEEPSGTNTLSEVANTETPNEAPNEANKNDSPANKYEEALNAFLKDGYYFKEGKKPDRIKNLSNVEILKFPEEVGLFGKFETTFDFEGSEGPVLLGRHINLVFVNTLNKNIEDVFDTIVSTLDNREIISDDDAAAFIGFHRELAIVGDMTIINVRSQYRSDRLDVYKDYDKIFIGYDQRRSKRDIIYIFKLEANK